jgi:hypothetical protein
MPMCMLSMKINSILFILLPKLDMLMLFYRYFVRLPVLMVIVMGKQ